MKNELVALFIMLLPHYRGHPSIWVSHACMSNVQSMGCILLLPYYCIYLTLLRLEFIFFLILTWGGSGAGDFYGSGISPYLD